MHAKSAEVSHFLDNDLLPQVNDAFAFYRSADKTELQKELSKVIAGRRGGRNEPGRLAQGQGSARSARKRHRGHRRAGKRGLRPPVQLLPPLLLGGRLSRQARLQAGRLRHPLRGRGGHALLGKQGPLLHQDQRVPARLRLPPEAGRREESDARALPADGRRRGKARQR